MSKTPGLILISGNCPALLFDAAWGIQPTASFLIRFTGPQEEQMRRMIPLPQTVERTSHGLHVRTGTEIFYNRDHDPVLANVTLKNHDLARCRHLSLGFWKGRFSNDNLEGELRGELRRVKLENEEMRTAWLKAFFGHDLSRVWVCAPLTEEGRQYNIKHYRLFCDEKWQPLPRTAGIAKSPMHALGWNLWGEPEQALPAELAMPAKEGPSHGNGIHNGTDGAREGSMDT
jgi:hypothetical protein